MEFRATRWEFDVAGGRYEIEEFRGSYSAHWMPKDRRFDDMLALHDVDGDEWNTFDEAKAACERHSTKHGKVAAE